MLGLLIKDFLTLKSYLKTIFFMLFIYAIWGYIGNSPAFIISFSSIFFSMVTITSIAYDENCHWNSYALTMPFNRKTLVLNKYILGFLLCMAGTLIPFTGAIIIAMINQSLTENMLKILFITAFVGVGIGLLFISIYLPFVFWLGAEKSRMIMISIFLVPAIIIAIIYKTAPAVIDIALNSLSILEKNPTVTVLSLISILVILLVLSLLVSLAIFRKKEF